MSKILLLRIYDNGTVRGLYSDGMEIEDLEKISQWCENRISDIKAIRSPRKPKE